MSPEDEEWLRRLQGPERETAIEELRQLLVRGLARSLANRQGDLSFAEDVAHDALLKILDNLDTFEGRSKFTTWALTIATRVGISELRRRRTKDISLDHIANGVALQFATEETPDARVENSMERAKVLGLLRELIADRLSEKQRFALEALLSGLPVEQIADRTGSNRNAIYKLVHDARKRLRSGFEEAGVQADDIQSLFA